MRLTNDSLWIAASLKFFEAQTPPKLSKPNAYRSELSAKIASSVVQDNKSANALTESNWITEADPRLIGQLLTVNQSSDRKVLSNIFGDSKAANKELPTTQRRKTYCQPMNQLTTSKID